VRSINADGMAWHPFDINVLLGPCGLVPDGPSPDLRSMLRQGMAVNVQHLAARFSLVTFQDADERVSPN